jgi:hypothetical protein
MPRPKKKSPAELKLLDVKNTPVQYYVQLDSGTEQEKTKAFEQFSKATDSYRGIYRSKALYDDYSNLQTNVSGRPGLDRSDYNKFRPQEAVPDRHSDIMNMCNNVYHKVGLVRNVIDLMSDFASQGIRLTHPNKKIEKFYRNWFKKVNGKERSERFLNILYRLGNVPIRIHTAKLTQKQKTTLFTTHAKIKAKEPSLPETPNSKEIPIKYIFLDPALLEIVGGSLASFVGKPVYAIKLPGNLTYIILSPRTPEEKALVAELPEDIKKAAKSNMPVILEPDKTLMYYYKKDDWCEWAKPMIYAILDDIITFEKLKLADRAALDGAISNIRIFKLGSMEYKIAPTDAAAEKLAEALQANVGGGSMDLIWGPDIELIESKTNVHQFLGEGKYTPHLNNIFAGLGIPPTLTGSGGSGGTTNNFISLKTLIQRLQYGRDLLVDFWEKECIKVQKAMGFRFAAKVEFDVMNLGDEVAEKALWIQLADRNLISDELLQMRFGADPDIEKIRTSRENRERTVNKRPEKAGPFHDPQFGQALKKIALQTGVLSPSEVGLVDTEKRDHLKTLEKKDGELSLVENNNKQMDKQLKEQRRQQKEQGTKPSGLTKNKKVQKPTKTGTPGRPKNKKDTQKRKTPKFRPKTRAALEVWAKAAQDKINNGLNSFLLQKFNKANFRQLTDKEVEMAEVLKMGVLFNLDPFKEVNEETIKAALAKPFSSKIRTVYNTWANDLSLRLNRKLTFEENRNIQTYLYSYIYSGETNES